jgi:lysine biosynthesis protein LysW
MVTNMSMTSGTVSCQNCSADIVLDNVLLNEVVECDDCAAEFEVVGLDPLVLEQLDEDEEDYGE